MNKCKTCGHLNRDDKEYCSSCGELVFGNKWKETDKYKEV